MDEAFHNENMCVVTYDAVRKAMDGEPFTMGIANKDEIQAITKAVNQGIDAHLEACFLEGKDSYELLGRKLECSISPNSLPVLLRRLSEDGSGAAINLISSILATLGFNEAGELIGREALGLE